MRYLHRTGWRGRDEGSRFGHVGPEAFRAFDFAGAGAKLIASVPGRHGGADPRDRREASIWGHPALRRALAPSAQQGASSALPTSTPPPRIPVVTGTPVEQPRMNEKPAAARKALELV